MIKEKDADFKRVIKDKDNQLQEKNNQMIKLRRRLPRVEDREA